MADRTARAVRWLTPPDVAEQLGCASAKVLQWIKAGELSAVNVATTANGRPRWRISPDALADFLERRRSLPPAPAVRRARRRRQAVKDFV